MFSLHELIIFALKQARACVFAGSFFILLFLSHHVAIPGLARYDFIFLGAILIQAILVLTKLESWEEVKVIFFFHIIGFVLEIFKTHPSIGSWSYPEASFFKLFDVPLYSGFMYAAVGSYISQAWNILKVKLTHYPKEKHSIVLAILIYINFFTHHILYDFRWILGGLVIILFSKTMVEFDVIGKLRRMPVVASFVFMAFFIWVAENISTFLGAWTYPNQSNGWEIVHFGKISSWGLLVIISFIIVSNLKHTESPPSLQKHPRMQ